MKFLQKHKDQPDAVPRSGLSKKKRRKDHALAKEEEISAYFTSVRRPLAEEDVNTQAKGVTHHTVTAQNRARNHEPGDSSVITNAIPTVELPDQEAYSRFGSRGPRQDSGSYISWSESARAPSATSLRCKAGFTINSGQLDALPGQDAGRVANGGELLHSQRMRSSTARHRIDDSKECFKVSSVVAPSHQVPRAQSYPRHTCSQYSLNSYHGVGRHRTTDSGARHSSQPPPKPLSKRNECDQAFDPHTRLRIRTGQRSAFVEEKRSTGQAETLQKEAILPPSDNEERPSDSSSLGKLLQECNSAFDGQRRQDAAVGKMDDLQAEQGPERPGAKKVLDQMPTYAVLQPPTVRFSLIDEHVPPIPNSTGTGMYEEQERWQSLVGSTSAHDSDIYYDAYDEGGDLLGEGEDDVEYDGQCWNDDDVPELRIPHGGNATAWEENEEAAMYRHPLRELRRTAGHGDAAVSGGFWRPHRLY